MKLRELPGALILGLLASLLAHTLSYGNNHAEAGAYHAILASLAIAAGLGFGVAITLLAASGSHGASDGSILARRLSVLIARTPAILGTAMAWFVVIESVEPAHGSASPIVLAIALIAASALMRILARCVTRTIADLAIAIDAPHFAGRASSYYRRERTTVRVIAPLVTPYRPARAPPAVMPSTL